MDLFPFEEKRPYQDELMNKVRDVLSSKHHLIVHAPTGVGKTASVLIPALEYALKNNLTIFFLTSRHTHHNIVLETLKLINQKKGVRIIVSDFVAKRWMCLQSGVSELNNFDFLEYCKSLRKEGACPFYNNFKDKGKKAVGRLIENSPVSNADIVSISNDQGVCPYEVACELGKHANVVIVDYMHIFEPHIRQSLFAKLNKTLEDSILIVDEAHNLPQRIRNMLSMRLTSFTINGALNESENADDIHEIIQKIAIILEMLSDESEKEETEIDREYLMDLIEQDCGFTMDEIITTLHTFGDEVRKFKKRSFCSFVAHFLEAWKVKSENYIRILRKIKRKHKTKESKRIELELACLDPAVASKPIIYESYSTIIMSGTLNPTSMYKEILGFPDELTEIIELPSPFPPKNRLALIIPDTSTKFEKRDEKQYQKIARHCSSISNLIPGNVAIFFPSYYIRDRVYEFFADMSNKTILLEKQDMSKPEKQELFNRFKSMANEGAVLMGVSGANFSEGVDLPGDFLKGVIIVGVPLEHPDIKTKALIDHYEKKFKAGWDYAYIIPAINKALQAAGRCIRSETDRGVVVFIDERFAWPKYFRLLPHSWRFTLTHEPAAKVKDFFSQEQAP